MTTSVFCATVRKRLFVCAGWPQPAAAFIDICVSSDVVSGAQQRVCSDSGQC